MLYWGSHLQSCMPVIWQPCSEHFPENWKVAWTNALLVTLWRPVCFFEQTGHSDHWSIVVQLRVIGWRAVRYMAPLRQSFTAKNKTAMQLCLFEIDHQAPLLTNWIIMIHGVRMNRKSLLCLQFCPQSYKICPSWMSQTSSSQLPLQTRGPSQYKNVLLPI